MRTDHLIARENSTHDGITPHVDEGYGALVEALPDVLYSIASPEGRITSLSSAFNRLTGWKREDWLGRSFVDLVHPDDLPLAIRTFEQACAGRAPGTYELRIRRASGEYLLAEFTSTPHVVNGRIVGELGMARDVSARRQAEEALRASEERYRLFFEEDLSGAFISRPDGKLLACNPEFARIFGFRSVQDALQNNAARLYPNPRSRQAFVDRVRKHRKLEYLEMELRDCNGRPVHVIENVSGTFDDRGELVEIRGYVIDNTERKKLEEQFLQAQKMEAVGRLAGGVAHDFNNLLTAILGYSDLLLVGIERGNPQRPLVEEIAKAGERAAELTRQLLAFSRKQVLRPQVLDLNRVVANLDKMIRLVLAEPVELVTRLEPGLHPVRADPGQIEQVLMNLVVNAKDAMPRGGRLTISTTNTTFGAADVPRPELKPGPYVVLTVGDTGCGISDEVKAHLFEPFFTTKEVGKGTGLGLATAYGIIRQSGGHIGVVSEPGQGATFSIYLPALTTAVEAETPPPAPAGGAETLLLVGEEEGLRSLMQTILSQLGYHVLEAAHAGDALAACENHDGPIDLLVTDLSRAGIGGRELAERLVPLRPAMKLLVLADYRDESSQATEPDRQPVPLLLKPFSPDALAIKVREALTGTTGSLSDTA
jgi:PAS domain S-box-containing protein